MTIKASSSTQISKCKAKFAEVKATAGSGKTHTLILRLMYWADIGVPADKILVLSYSRETVAELHRRIKGFQDKSAGTPSKFADDKSLAAYLSKVTIQTAHGFADRLVSQQEVLSHKAAVALFSKAIKAAQRNYKNGALWPDVSAEIKQLRLKRLAVLAEAENLPFVLKFLDVAQASKATITEAVLRPQFADLAPYVKVLLAVRRKYAAIKKQNVVIDFGDMLSQATNAIRNGAPTPYTHILVDEYQDCSAAQVHLLAEVAKLDGRNIMVFGDPNQAIYGFGGASYTPLSEVLDGVVELNIPRSRRLTKPNAALASAILGLSPALAIQTSRDGEKPVLVCDKTETKQINHVALDIKQLIDAGTPPEKIALLARKTALLNPVEKALLVSGVQTKRKGTMQDRKHMLRVLHLVDIVAQCEKRGTKITPEVLKESFKWSTGIEDSRWKDVSLRLKNVLRVPSLEARYRLCAKIYLWLVGGMRSDKDRHAEVNRWETICRAHASARVMRNALREMDQAAVVTGTIHSAKGGEWDHVFVVGVTEGHLPDYRSRDEFTRNEERRLFYVAVTRARETVRLFHSPANDARSRQRFEKMSSFLDRRVRNTLRTA